MSWEQVSTNAIDIKKTKGEPHEGTYTGKQEITTKIGPQIIWQFEGEGGNFGIYGFTNLNHCMQALKVGTLVKIVYEGTKHIQTKYGMKDVHQVSVKKWKGEQEEEVLPGEDGIPF